LQQVVETKALNALEKGTIMSQKHNAKEVIAYFALFHIEVSGDHEVGFSYKYVPERTDLKVDCQGLEGELKIDNSASLQENMQTFLTNFLDISTKEAEQAVLNNSSCNGAIDRGELLRIKLNSLLEVFILTKDYYANSEFVRSRSEGQLRILVGYDNGDTSLPLEFNISSLCFVLTQDSPDGLLNALLPKGRDSLLYGLERFLARIRPKVSGYRYGIVPIEICLELRCKPEFAIQLLVAEYSIAKIGDTFLIGELKERFPSRSYYFRRPKKDDELVSKGGILERVFLTFGGIKQLVQLIEKPGRYVDFHKTPARIKMKKEKPPESSDTCFVINASKLPSGGYSGYGYVLTDADVCFYVPEGQEDPVLVFANVVGDSAIIYYKPKRDIKEIVQIYFKTEQPSWHSCDVMPQDIGRCKIRGGEEFLYVK